MFKKLYAIGLVSLFVATFIVEPLPEFQSPFGDGLTCWQFPDNSGSFCMRKWGDFSPQYYIDPNGKKTKF